jgi:hypothetical protein
MGVSPLLFGAFDLPADTLSKMGWYLPYGLGTNNPHQDLAGNGTSYTTTIEATGTYGPSFASSDAGIVTQYVYLAGTSTLKIFLFLAGQVQARIDIACISGTSAIYRGDGTTSLVTAAATTVGGHLVEIEADCANSGRIRVWLDRAADGSPYLDTGAGVDTQQLASPDFDQVAWTSTGNNNRLSDVIVSPLSDGRLDREHFLVVLRPDGDGGTTDLTPSTGTDNYATVDETSPSTSDYNEATAAGQLDRYTYPALPYSPLGIGFVASVCTVARDGTITQGRTTIKSGATTASGTYQTIGSAGAYHVVWDAFDVDPNTAADWLEADVNAVEAGPQFN